MLRGSSLLRTYGVFGTFPCHDIFVKISLLGAHLRFEKDKVLHATSEVSDDRKVHRRTSETNGRFSEMNEDSYLAFVETYGHEEWMSSVASRALLHLHPVQSSCFSNVRYHQ